MIGFPSSTITADLAGATVTKVRVLLYFYHWAESNGGTAIVGSHGNSTKPATFTGNTNRYQYHNWLAGTGHWLDITTAIPGSEWAAGTTKGITVGPGLTTGYEYYGRAYGPNKGTGPTFNADGSLKSAGTRALLEISFTR